MQGWNVEAEHLADCGVASRPLRGGHAEENSHGRGVDALRQVLVDVRHGEGSQVSPEAEGHEQAAVGVFGSRVGGGSGLVVVGRVVGRGRGGDGRGLVVDDPGAADQIRGFGAGGFEAGGFSSGGFSKGEPGVIDDDRGWFRRRGRRRARRRARWGLRE